LTARSLLAAFVAFAPAAICAAPAAADVGTITEYPIPTANSTPRAITAGPDGRLWFTEYYASKIGRITTDGQIGAGDEIATPTPFASPSGITLGPDGNLWFSETAGGANSRIGRIAPTATSSSDILEIAVPTANSSPEGITAGPDGRIWFTEYGSLNGGRIGVLATTATTTGEITEFGIDGGGTPNPFGIVNGPGGKLWFTAFSTGKIGRIAPPGATVPTTDQFAAGSPLGITVGPDGNLWAAEQGTSKIARITPDGVVTEFPTYTPNRQPFGIAAGPDGRIWFTEAGGTTNHIGVMTTNGVMTAGDEYTIPTDGANPLFITPGPDNRMWFTESNGYKIGAITTGVAPPSGGGTTPPGGSTPPPPGSGAEPPAGHAVLVGCAPNRLILTDVFPKGRRTQIIGVAPAGSAGKRVTIISTWDGRTVARATVGADLSFAAATALPPARLRSSNRARYAAKLGSKRSGALKFARRMYTTAVTNQGRTITFSGTVTRPLDKPPRPISIRASASCSTIGSGAVVATVKPSASGAFSARFDLPAGMTTAFLRAQTRVRKHAGSRTTFPTYTLIRGIRLAS
jgi:streptogramin lyase